MANTYGSEQPRILHPEGTYKDWGRLKAAVEGGIIPIVEFTGNVADGDTVSIGDQIFEFDTDGEVVAGNIPLDVRASLTPASAAYALGVAITQYNNAGGDWTTITEYLCTLSGGNDGISKVCVWCPTGTVVAKSGANITVTATTETWTPLTDGQTLKLRSVKADGTTPAKFEATNTDYVFKTYKRIIIEGDVDGNGKPVTELKQAGEHDRAYQWSFVTPPYGFTAHGHFWCFTTSDLPITLRNLILSNPGGNHLLGVHQWTQLAGADSTTRDGTWRIENCRFDGGVMGFQIHTSVVRSYPNWSLTTPYDFSSPVKSWIKNCEFNCPWIGNPYQMNEWEFSNNTWNMPEDWTYTAVTNRRVYFRDNYDEFMTGWKLSPGRMVAALLLPGDGGTFVLKANGTTVDSELYTLLNLTGKPFIDAVEFIDPADYDPTKVYTADYTTKTPYMWDVWGMEPSNGVRMLGLDTDIISRNVEIFGNTCTNKPGETLSVIPTQLNGGDLSFIDIEQWGAGVTENWSIHDNTLLYKTFLTPGISLSGLSPDPASIRNCDVSGNTFDYCANCLGQVYSDGWLWFWVDAGMPIAIQNVTFADNIIEHYQLQGDPAYQWLGYYRSLAPFTMLGPTSYQINIVANDFKDSGLLPVTSFPDLPPQWVAAVHMDVGTQSCFVKETGSLPPGEPTTYLVDDGTDNRIIGTGSKSRNLTPHMGDAQRLVKYVKNRRRIQPLKA